MIELPFTDHSFRTIYADPPWSEIGGGKIVRGAPKTLRPDEDAGSRGDGARGSQGFRTNAHLYLWVTNNFLEDGLQIMSAWGFTYKTMITWTKDRMDLGNTSEGSRSTVFSVSAGCCRTARPTRGSGRRESRVLCAPRRALRKAGGRCAG